MLNFFFLYISKVSKCCDEEINKLDGKGYCVGFHSGKKSLFVRCLTRCLSVAFYFQDVEISLFTAMHKDGKHIFSVHTHASDLNDNKSLQIKSHLCMLFIDIFVIYS